ncbi:BRO-N domain-containing protein [Moraxella bovis]|uniref:BRO family, N-terminal domain n=1 Tax=Moraxella bovis TaxID=476 RepID=A0A378PXT4_MORBO|nr:BRO family protein [Moraxella bovis]STY93423.1 BRO family, N-terminal domain [Moraxella bovis]
MQTLTFQNITLSPAKVDNQIWLTSGELAKALNYADTQSVTKIYERNADEFTTSMTTIAQVKTNGGMQKMRIFSLRGCHLIAMFARTKVAKEFRQWVLDILDKEVGKPVQVEPKLSSDDTLPLRNAVSMATGILKLDYATIYKMVHQRFGIDEIKELSKDEVGQAVEYVHSLMVQVNQSTINMPLIQNILADNAHQNQKARLTVDGMIGELKVMIDYVDELRTRLTLQDRLIGALQTRFIG